MSSGYSYNTDTLLEDFAIEWTDAAGAVRDFSTGWTFELRLMQAEDPKVLVATKSAGITGASASPNVVIAWAAGDFNVLAPGEIVGELYATRGSDSKPSRKKIDFILEPAASAAS